MQEAISYAQISGGYESSWYIPYEILLNTIEWKNFRQHILSRDGNSCSVCNRTQSEKIGGRYFRKPTEEEITESRKPVIIDIGNGDSISLKRAQIINVITDDPVILHVHHKFYIYDNLPWQYDLDALITVCHKCHGEIHFTQKIPVYTNAALDKEIDLIVCSRCKGTGFLNEFHYHQDGICFNCNGRKFEKFTV
jgi:hypothetical protein